MVYAKTFPREIKGSQYPRWEEINLSDEEEIVLEKDCMEENKRVLKQCLNDAKRIMKDMGLKNYQTDVISLAMNLFRKQASHAVFWKEKKCKERFDELFKKTTINTKQKFSKRKTQLKAFKKKA
ncbi:hypothetical protein ACFL0W_01275 [Nanoarchaeota archaeon]